MQTLQPDYFAAYRNLKLSLDDKGVLLAEFHSDGGPYIINAQGHTEFVDAFLTAAVFCSDADALGNVAQSGIAGEDWVACRR
jgi:hypothetical protein